VAAVAAMLLAIYVYKRADSRQQPGRSMVSFENPVYQLEEADVIHAYDAPGTRDITATTEV